MLFWLSDHANLLYFVLGATVLGLLAAGWMTRRTKFWGYAGGAAGLMVLVWLLTQLVVTDRQRIALNLDAMARAAEENKPEIILQHVSKDFRFGRLTGEELANRIRAAVKLNKVNQVRLLNKQVTVNGDAAEAIFNFRADSADGGMFVASAQAKFGREAGAWKLRELQVFKFGTTERQFVPGID